MFPANQQSQVRAQLAFVLEGVVTQTLVPKAKGRGRVCCMEIMVCTPAIRACIRDDKVHQIYSIMQAGKKHGMQTMNDALYQIYIAGEVTMEDAAAASRTIRTSSCAWSASPFRTPDAERFTQTS